MTYVVGPEGEKCNRGGEQSSSPSSYFERGETDRGINLLLHGCGVDLRKKR